jgi:hypothetical protein
MHRHWPAHLSFSFGGFLGQNMTLERMTTFKTAVARASKTLGSTTVGLDFWHLFAPTNNKKIPEKNLARQNAWP